MSRSQKKNPIYKYKISGGKKAAARAFRRFEGDVPPSSRQFFRRVYNSYNVWDNWWLASSNLKDKARFRQIANELKSNEINPHLTEEEAYELLDELEDLKYSFRYFKK